MLRVLKPSGSIVITLPAFPHYVEEWTSTLPYWGGNVQNEDSKTFFQRRYDHNTLLRRFSIPDGVIREVILIAEKPIEPPRINKNGMMVHNSYLIDIFFVSRLLKMLGSHLRVPFSEYLAEFIVSRKHHYLTTEWTDPNIRQVAVKITKVVNT